MACITNPPPRLFPLLGLKALDAFGYLQIVLKDTEYENRMVGLILKSCNIHVGYYVSFDIPEDSERENYTNQEWKDLDVFINTFKLERGSSILLYFSW